MCNIVIRNKKPISLLFSFSSIAILSIKAFSAARKEEEGKNTKTNIDHMCKNSCVCFVLYYYYHWRNVDIISLPSQCFCSEKEIITYSISLAEFKLCPNILLLLHFLVIIIRI